MNLRKLQRGLNLPIPFRDQMVCMLCRKTAEGPAYCGGWRCIDLDRRMRAYACPECQPGQEGTEDQWSAFYYELMKNRILALPHNSVGKPKHPVRHIVVWRESEAGPPVKVPVI